MKNPSMVARASVASPRRRCCLPIVALLALSSPALAWEKGMSCVAVAADGSAVYVSRPTHDISAGMTTVHSLNFEKFVVLPGDHVRCWMVGSASSTQEEDAEYHARSDAQSWGAEGAPMHWVVIDGDVVGNGTRVRTAKAAVAAPVPKPKPKPTPPGASSGGSLVVAPAKSTVVPGWDAKVQEQLRKDADARAKSAALTAANDARIKAEVAEAIRKLKAQGRAQ